MASLAAPRPSPVQLVLAQERAPLPRPRAGHPLHRVRHRVYADATAWEALAPWDRYLARVHAVALARPNSVFCLESAAALLGQPLFGEPRDIHVLVEHRRTSDRHGDVFVHVSHDPRGLVRWDSIRATDAAHTATDLMRVLPPAFGLAVADAAISPRQLGDCTIAQLAAIVAGQHNRRGRRLVEWCLARADPLSESSGESISRAVIEWLGYPAPQLQQTFTFEGFRDRTDFFWDGFGTAGESDGYGKYDPSDPEAARAALVAEKVREDRLRRHLDHFTRWDWKAAMQAEPLDRMLAGAGLPRVEPRQHAMIATLRRNPRSLAAAAGRVSRRPS